MIKKNEFHKKTKTERNKERKRKLKELELMKQREIKKLKKEIDKLINFHIYINN